jgi:hypothetical protein
MAATSPRGITPPESTPELTFAVEGAGALEYSVVPTLRFALRIESPGVPIRSIALNTQIRIAAARRSYARGEQARMLELFGEPHRWGTTLRSLLWAHTTVHVPAFVERTVIDLPLALTYDFEVVATRYLHALEDGEIPLELLFSGTVFYAGEQGLLRTALISWDKEAGYRLPVAVWREAMDHFFPDSAWLRLRRESFDRLNAYKSRHALTSWEAAVEALVDRAEHAER